jgi:hypothetical protein
MTMHTSRLSLIAGFVLLVLEMFASPAQARAPLAVSIDFPGGSAEVLGIDQTTRQIRIAPSAHPNRGWVCWWYLEVTGLEVGEMLTLDVGDAPWATPDRAAVSDDGKTWRQTDRGARHEKRITYRYQATAEKMWFAWGPPFVPADAETLVKRVAKSCERAEAFELCRSREDRPVWAIRFQPPPRQDANDAPPLGLWFQARQHAWESGSSWVAQGLIEWLASDDDRARTLRSKAEIIVVPIMDVDNVASGAGGKNEAPQDHNRDWTDKPYHPAVAAAQANIKALNDAGQFDLFVDLHNPGASSQNPFFYTSPVTLLSEQGAHNLEHFLAAARLEMTGPLAFKGETQESGAKYDKNWQSISKNWVTHNTAKHVVSVTLETAWNTPNSTASGYQTVGRNLGLATERYLRASPR